MTNLWIAVDFETELFYVIPAGNWDEAYTYLVNNVEVFKEVDSNSLAGRLCLGENYMTVKENLDCILELSPYEFAMTLVIGNWDGFVSIPIEGVTNE